MKFTRIYCLSGTHITMLNKVDDRLGAENTFSISNMKAMKSGKNELDAHVWLPEDVTPDARAKTIVSVVESKIRMFNVIVVDGESEDTTLLNALIKKF